MLAGPNRPLKVIFFVLQRRIFDIWCQKIWSQLNEDFGFFNAFFVLNL
jgi:hypothetical protein